MSTPIEAMTIYRYDDAPVKFQRLFPGLKGGWVVAVPLLLQDETKVLMTAVISELGKCAGGTTVAKRVSEKTGSVIYLLGFTGPVDETSSSSNDNRSGSSNKRGRGS